MRLFIRTQVKAFTLVLMRNKKYVIYIINTDRFFCFNSTVSYTEHEHCSLVPIY
jgi:hypothetical protein